MNNLEKIWFLQKRSLVQILFIEKDIMPLIYHHEGKQDYKRRKEVVEMQIAVSFDEELRVLQTWITTIQRRFLQVVAITVVLNFVLEDLHAKNGIDVIKYLKYVASLY